MAGRTIHRFIGGTGALQVVGDFGMALGTLDVLVDRIGQLTGSLNRGKSYHHPPFYADLFILVAFHAGIV